MAVPMAKAYANMVVLGMIPVMFRLIPKDEAELRQIFLDNVSPDDLARKDKQVIFQIRRLNLHVIKKIEAHCLTPCFLSWLINRLNSVPASPQ